METPHQVPPPPSPNEAQVAGFWRRFLGAFVDSILIGLVGYGLGLVFFDYFAGIGAWGRLVGFGVALLYYAPFNSRLGGGRTIGKRAAGIRVVGRDGEPIGLPQSIVRFIILSAPFLLNGLPLAPSVFVTWIGNVIGIIIFGIGGAIIYLIVFNRRTRQSLHDLIAGSFVVKRESQGAITAKTWGGHYFVVTLILLASAIVPLALRPLTKSEFFKAILALDEKISAEPEISNASVFEAIASTQAAVRSGATKKWAAGSSASKNLAVTVWLRNKTTDFDMEANKIAGIVLRDFPRAHEKDQISIRVKYGFDIGIAQGWRGGSGSYTPAEWESRTKTPPR